MGQGPLAGLRVVEFAGIGPGPFCGMMLSDFGADVVRIDRPGAQPMFPTDITTRGRRSVAFDLKKPEAIEAVLTMIERADAVIEGFRPGVMERLGLGPDVALARNPKLVYGRMTGWGQEGPLAKAAGHDINYIALTGALDAIGTKDKPIAPLNLVGDFGGGAMYLAFGLLAGVLHARETGQGQVVDAAMIDGASSLMAWFYGLKACGRMNGARRTNTLDGGAHFYDTYQCSDGKWLAVGSVEAHFHRLLLDKLGISDLQFERQNSRDDWPELQAKLGAVFRTRSRDEWCELLEGTDACVAPVLTADEAPLHPHNAERQTFVTEWGVLQPAPAPRFSATPGRIAGPPPSAGQHNDAALSDWGFSPAALAALRTAAAI